METIFSRKLRERVRCESHRGKWRMALETWDALQERLGLLALGYQRLLWIHIHCAQHGLWRTAIAEEQESYACPVCSVACKCVILAAGYTRQQLPLTPERIIAPLSPRTQQELMRPEKPPKRPRRIPDVHHGQKLRRGMPEHQPACDSRPRARVVRSWAMPDR
jgi:glycine/D-amino acid oxidase-like deaminating enzyme